MGDSQERGGFTIIEVSLVLAIAGLILLMVFIALPALQRSQRDSRRRDDISILLRKIKDYQTNNRGMLPGSPDVLQDYLDKDFGDPSSGTYKLVMKKCGNVNVGSECANNMKDTTSFPNDYTVLILQQATCDGGMAVGSKNTRKVAVQYVLEGGGIYCANT